MAKKKIVKKKAKKKVAKKVLNEDFSSTEKEQNKQLIYFFVIMLLLLGGFLGTYFYFQQSNRFSYAGVDFEKGKTGEVEYYHGKMEMPALSSNDNRLIYNLFLRIDPRKNKVPINVDTFALSSTVFISFDPEIVRCGEMVVAQGNLEQFLIAFPWVNRVMGATTDQNYSEERNLNFEDCNSSTDQKTVIEVRNSEIKSIEKEGNCYILNVGDCEYLEVSERLIVGLVAKINEETI